MKVIKKEMNFCLGCMEEHEMEIVELDDSEIYKGVLINFKAIYERCPKHNLMYESEDMIRQNMKAMRKAYRKTREE